jgi:hypothetical protein
MWTGHPVVTVDSRSTEGHGGRWAASHDGFRSSTGAVHRREVAVAAGTVSITDSIEGPRAVPGTISYHLGPAVECSLERNTARLSWPSAAGADTATLELPRGLAWEAHRGGVDPIIGWYSPEYGSRTPTWALVGTGTFAPGAEFSTTLLPAGVRPDQAENTETTGTVAARGEGA